MDNFDIKKPSNIGNLSSGFGSDDSCVDKNLLDLQNYEEKKWKLSHLKSHFESLELHLLFKSYTDKINHGWVSLFLILQFLLSLTHFIVLILGTYIDTNDMTEVLPDLVLYVLLIILSLLGFYLIERLTKKGKLIHQLSLVHFAAIFIVNFFIPYYNNFFTNNNTMHYRAAYTSNLIISCYVFFNIHDIVISFLMGLFVSIFDIITLILITYTNEEMLWQRLVSDAIYLFCINGLGFYLRYLNEIVIRRSFLDRRDYIMSTFQLRHEEEQKQQLMSSIIPSNMITKVKENYLEGVKYYEKNKKYLQKSLFDSDLVEVHDNVSILFADIVHYTEMTQKLNITELLETLNDLFGWFDDTSKDLNVIRIKFLGDCYYCVAGLPPDPAPNHAEACVDLGLAMISIIASVRKKRNLNINMRIGVHSGKIISGIIGAVKIQYDIWSKDVDIANIMESEGEAGKVHITDKTKTLLQKRYNITPTRKGQEVPQFRKNNLETFLVSPKDVNENRRRESERDPNDKLQIYTPKTSLYKKQKSKSNEDKSSNSTTLLNLLQNKTIQEKEEITTKDFPLIIIKKNNMQKAENLESDPKFYRRRTTNIPYGMSRINEDSSSIMTDIKRRTAFMNNNIKRYSERATAVNEELKKTINEISFSKYVQYLKISEMNVLPTFKNFGLECGYIKLPDPLFKYYLISTIFLIIFVYLIQNMTLPQWDFTTWPFLTFELLIILIFVPLSWTHFIWNKYVSNYVDVPPENKFINFLCNTSKCITRSFLARIILYTLIFVLFYACVLLELINCTNSLPPGSLFKTINFFSISFNINNSARTFYPDCVIPWHMTQTCALTVVVTFLFLRILIWIKLFYSFIIISVYSFCVIYYSDGFYELSETYNNKLRPQVAHIMFICFITLTLFLIDRQTDYMNRLNYLTNEKLKNEQKEATKLQVANENLLMNILPKHVAKIYLDVKREISDLYYENHNDVAIMFASIIINETQEQMSENDFLMLMNAYITEFDTLINRKAFRIIEKIKIAKWTYMAACGLFPNEKMREIEIHATSITLEVLLNFASNMFKKIEHINRQTFQDCKLRIGISHGSIVAGVVGSKKPLYDIWGDAVNMASRMDSTGVPGKIQVLKGTAQIIENLGYVCDYRGEIKVKGKEGLVRTFFVRLDDKHELVKSKTDNNINSA